MIMYVPLRENRVALLKDCARVVRHSGRIVLSYYDNQVVKKTRSWTTDGPPDRAAMDVARGYSILETGDRFGHSVRGRTDDGALDQDFIYGYSHRCSQEQIESELNDAGLAITDHVSDTELSGESTGYYIVAAVHRTSEL